MPSYEDLKENLVRFLGGEHNADMTAYGAADKEDKELGPVRDFKFTFRTADRADFDKVHASLRHYLNDNIPSALITAFSAAEKDDKEGGRLREFRAGVRIPLLAGAPDADPEDQAEHVDQSVIQDYGDPLMKKPY